ncbi:MAG: DUF4215 domain-containing protein [Anaeromyxobacter sp.]
MVARSLVALTLFVACGGQPSIEDPDGSSSEGGTKGRGGSTSTSTDPGIPEIPDASTPDAGTDAVCGNGKVEIGEICDDGNRTDGDGCKGNCLEQDPDYICSDGKCVKYVICGDGQLQGDEACDDGNTNAGDGCSANCKSTESGFECARPNKPCVALSICGNGVRERGEQCDDAQLPPKDGDGCSSTCQLEAGYFCPTGATCVKYVCGDGARTPDEDCDDGNATNGDGCSSTCKKEDGWIITESGAKAACGDGLIRGNEACDDKNQLSGDGCSATCKLEPLTVCTGEPSICSSTISCGDGKVQGAEVCDPPSATCSSDCRRYIVPGTVCGNGVWESGEACEDSGTLDGDGCSASCTVEMGWRCPQVNYCFKLPVCGNTVRERGEGCDDGNQSSGDGCTSSCQLEPGYFCPPGGACILLSCGNGVRTRDEQCDDGNLANDDGCSSTCKLELGWIDTGTGTKPICGDGLIRTGEACDDGNNVNGDGCSSACRVEPLMECTGQPSVCVSSIECGDNEVQGTEVCDSAERQQLRCGLQELRHPRHQVRERSLGERRRLR